MDGHSLASFNWCSGHSPGMAFGNRTGFIAPKAQEKKDHPIASIPKHPFEDALILLKEVEDFAGYVADDRYRRRELKEKRANPDNTPDRNKKIDCKLEEVEAELPRVEEELKLAQKDLSSALSTLLAEAPDPLQARAIEFVIEGRSEEAEKIYQELDARFPAQPLRLAEVYALVGKWNEAHDLIRSLGPSATAEEQLGGLCLLTGMARALYHRDANTEGVPFAESALAMARDLFGRGTQETLPILRLAGKLHAEAEQNELAQPLLVEAFEISRRFLGENNQETLDLQATLSKFLFDCDELAKAEPLLIDLLMRRRETLGKSHEKTLDTLNEFGWVLFAQGRADEAKPVIEEAYGLTRETLGDHSVTLDSVHLLGLLLADSANPAGAEQFALEALALSRKVKGEKDKDTLQIQANLATLYDRLGRRAEATPIIAEAFQICRAEYGGEDPQTLSCMQHFASLACGGKHFEKLEAFCQLGLERSRGVLGDRDTTTLGFMGLMILMHVRSKQWDLAEQLILEQLQIRTEMHGRRHPQTRDSLSGLASIYEATGRLVEAEKLLVECQEASRQDLGERHPEALSNLYILGSFHARSGDREKGIRLLLQAEVESRHLDDEVDPRRGILERIAGLGLTYFP